jgi:hypothetical protein
MARASTSPLVVPSARARNTRDWSGNKLDERKSAQRRARSQSSPAARKARRKFLHYFPQGFRDETYIAWERQYKQDAHERWEEQLGRDRFRAMLRAGQFVEVAAAAVKIESRTNLLFSFEKMAVRDAVKSATGAKLFAQGLYNYLYGPGDLHARFDQWCAAVGDLPRRQTRVLTWPVLTVFPFIARPDQHIFLKPTVTRVAARKYGFDFIYHSRPTWETYASVLSFAETVRRDVRDLRPRDMIDLQSFIWVQGSDEYPD